MCCPLGEVHSSILDSFHSMLGSGAVLSGCLLLLVATRDLIDLPLMKPDWVSGKSLLANV